MKVTIIGPGKVGFEIARRLDEEGYDIVFIDKSEEKLEKLQERMDALAIKGNGATAAVLKDTNVIDSDLVIALTNSDEINMIACMIAKKLGIPSTIARVRDPDYAKDLLISKEGMGIDLVINPEYAASTEICRVLSMALPVFTEPFGEGMVQLAEVKVDEDNINFVNKKIFELKLPKPSLIVAISRKGEIIVPWGGDKIHAGDVLYILGYPKDIGKICSKIKRKKHRISSVMILGGGRIGFYLAEKLCSMGMKVKIIEQNAEKCEELAERLPDALILRGDGSDVELLKREGLSETDGFVAVTGLDEENLLISLLAKQMGAKRVIAKVSRPSYAPLVQQLGVDAAISPRLITASEILRFIRGGRVPSLYLLLNGNAEVVELPLQPNSRVNNKPLSKCGLPKGVLVGAILRDNRAIIPQGDEVIMEGDRLVVFALNQSLKSIEAMFNR
ncbi:Trk system potassium transporter TrkA [Desulfolucanica intricata]|uniref:Trk system potassium transporter TrkA n=1 Tax=Desulfolucanica intricata TaxID=1285191 RepID=UPI00082D33C1|nr:Trk system potassium transporter TrkA [Desulfolucanica intricata]